MSLIVKDYITRRSFICSHKTREIVSSPVIRGNQIMQQRKKQQREKKTTVAKEIKALETYRNHWLQSLLSIPCFFLFFSTYYHFYYSTSINIRLILFSKASLFLSLSLYFLLECLSWCLILKKKPTITTNTYLV